jgi:hypothetical protein
MHTHYRRKAGHPTFPPMIFHSGFFISFTGGRRSSWRIEVRYWTNEIQHVKKPMNGLTRIESGFANSCPCNSDWRRIINYDSSDLLWEYSDCFEASAPRWHVEGYRPNMYSRVEVIATQSVEVGRIAALNKNRESLLIDRENLLLRNLYGRSL